MTQYIKHGLRLSTLAAAIALAGCGEDFKDCNGTWDRLLGRSSCAASTPAVTPTGDTTVAVQLAPAATQGKTVEIVSTVDEVSSTPISGNASTSVQLDTQKRDTVMALVDDNIALYALKYEEKPVSLTPASTATYLVLQLKGMLNLPDTQLKQAVLDIESNPTYPKLASYIDFKIRAGFSDPLNVEADPALMQLVMEISNQIDAKKYQASVISLNESIAIQKIYSVHRPSKEFSFGDLLLGIVGIQAAHADESTIMGNNELILAQEQEKSNNVKFANHRFNPFFAYVNDGSQSGRWNYIAGRDSIVEFDFKLEDIEKAANIKAEDGKFMRTLKRIAAIPKSSIKQGKEETTLALNGVNVSGRNTLFVESQGVCQAVFDGGSLDEMTHQQMAASVLNAFSLFMAAAEVGLAAQDLKNADAALTKALTNPTIISQLVDEYRKIRDSLKKSALGPTVAREKLEKVKMYNEFLKEFIDHAIKIQDKNKIENELLFLRGALEASDQVISIGGKILESLPKTDDGKKKGFLKELGSSLGEDLKEETIKSAAIALAELTYGKSFSPENSAKTLKGLSDYAVNVLQTSDVIAALFPVKGDDVDALKVVDAVTHNVFFQQLFTSAIEKAAPDIAKKVLKDGYRAKAAQFNLVTKAAALTWGTGTKLLPMMWDSCTTSKKLSIAINDGKISQYQAPKVDLWIEDLTTGKPVYWFNNTGDSLSASGDTLNVIQGRKYRIHVKAKQAGVLDRSLDDQKDAVHRGTFRPPIKVNGLFIQRHITGADSQVLLHKQLCARRALQDNIEMLYGLNRFSTSVGFSCAEGQIGSDDFQLFSPPFNQTNGFVQKGDVNYSTTVLREGVGFSSWNDLISGSTKTLGFGGEVYDTVDFTEDQLTKSIRIEVEGFDDSVQYFDIKAINTADAVIQSNAKASAANPIVYVGEAITAKLEQVVGSVVGVFWQLINSLGEVVKGISAAVADSVSFETTDLSGGAYEIKAELRDENAEPIGVVSQAVQLAQTTFQSVNVHSMPVGVPVAISVYGKDLPNTAVFALEGVPCGQPVVTNDSVTQVCTATEAKDNVKLTVKQKTMVNEGSRIFGINITPKTVTGQFVVPANSAGVEFIPPVDNEPVVGTLGQVLEYGASRRNMTCSFKATGTTKTYRSYDPVDANGYAILPLHNGFRNMALIANDALIGVEKTGVAVKAGERLSFKLNDNEPADNEGALTVAYSCEEVAQSDGYTVLNRNGAECVQDNKTGLIWEQKTDDGGLRDKDWGYSWYDPNRATNGGYAGRANGGTCFNRAGGAQCDTTGYVAALNAANYCGYSDWRMPAIGELQGLVNTAYRPTIAPVFVNTWNDWYWSASPVAGGNNDAWLVGFHGGYTSSYGKDFSYRVQAVRAGLASGGQPGQSSNTGSANVPGNSSGQVTDQDSSGRGPSLSGSPQATATGSVVLE